MIDFADYMDQERARIHGERTALIFQKASIEEALAQLDRDMQAIDAYAAAKAGKVPTAKRAPRHTNGAGTRRAPHGSKRENIVATITAYPQGLTRGELLELMGLKGDKSGEMSVSNALTSLVKNDTLARNDERKYVLSV